MLIKSKIKLIPKATLGVDTKTWLANTRFGSEKDLQQLGVFDSQNALKRAIIDKYRQVFNKAWVTANPNYSSTTDLGYYNDSFFKNFNTWFANHLVNKDGKYMLLANKSTTPSPLNNYYWGGDTLTVGLTKYGFNPNTGHLFIVDANNFYNGTPGNTNISIDTLGRWTLDLLANKGYTYNAGANKWEYKTPEDNLNNSTDVNNGYSAPSGVNTTDFLNFIVARNNQNNDTSDDINIGTFGALHNGVDGHWGKYTDNAWNTSGVQNDWNLYLNWLKTNGGKTVSDYFASLNSNTAGAGDGAGDASTEDNKYSPTKYLYANDKYVQTGMQSSGNRHNMRVWLNTLLNNGTNYDTSDGIRTFNGRDWNITQHNLDGTESSVNMFDVLQGLNALKLRRNGTYKIRRGALRKLAKNANWQSGNYSALLPNTAQSGGGMGDKTPIPVTKATDSKVTTDNTSLGNNASTGINLLGLLRESGLANGPFDGLWWQPKLESNSTLDYLNETHQN